MAAEPLDQRHVRAVPPHIELLLQRRDEIVWAWAEEHPGEDVFEDRALDITSQMPLSVEETLAQVERALAEKN